MPPERKLSFLSLRFLVILFIGGMTTIFGLVFTAIFQTTMPTMLLESEHKYLARQVRLVNGLLSSARENVALLTEDTAIWEETYRFALGENPEYIASNWPGKSLLESFRLSFVIIKDKDGNNLYASFYNLRAKKTIEEPEGFSERLIPLTAGVMAEYAADPNASRQGKFGREGFAIFDGVAYDVAIMPIVQSKGEEASGALIMGYILDADYFQMLTHYDESVHFNISPNMDKTDWGNQSISLETQDTVTIHLPLISITNQPLVLTMTEPRQIYSSGQSLLDKATTMRFIVLVVFGVLLYQIIVRLLLHPVEQLSGDIHHIAEAEDTDSASLPVEKYSGSSELRTLCIAINTTLKKFRQSTISLDVLRRILNGIDAYLYVVDPADDTILFLNDKLAAHCNIQGNPVGRSCREIFGEESAGHGSFSVAGHLASKPGETLSWEGGSAATGRLYRNTDCLIEWVDGKTVHLRHSVDITDIKETEGQLVRMSSIVENSPQFIFYMSAQGSFEYANKGAQTALGYTPEEVIRGGSRLLFGSRALADEMYESIIPAILDKGKYAFTRPLLRKDGESRVFSFSAFTVEQKDPGIGAICVDVTNQHRLEKDLIAAKEQAERSSDAKSEFLSRMSHEMRTPLNAIIGMTSIANTARDLEKKQYCLDKISEASKHLLGVINDILDMSKIEANKFELSYAEFVFERMLIRVLDVVNFRIEEKRLRLSVTIDPSIPYSLVSDEQRISQVIANLLSNAVKFTPEQGTITLSATLSAEKNGLCSLIIAVADSGIGIPQEHQAKLFRSFEQADGSISRKFGGTGLGLAISKRIVELLGGEIWVESEPDKGSRFAFTLKAERGKATRRSMLPANVAWRDLRILVVDDAPDVRDYFLSLAGNIGFACEAAHDGDEALALLERERQGFNLVFMDWLMPGMNGVELARKIRESGQSPTIVLMLSATEWNAIEPDAREAGVDRFIPKPLFSSLIVDCINNCLGVSSAASDAADRTDEAGIFAGSAILLADDIDINREIVITLLEDTGIAIDCAENGAVACEMFRANPSRYAVIFMDIHMPEVDGYEATRRIRTMADIPEAASIPVIAMTANVFREDIERCLAAGMNGHIGKPINFDEMIAKLRAYCR